MAMPLLGVSPFAFYMCINALQMNVLLEENFDFIFFVNRHQHLKCHK